MPNRTFTALSLLALLTFPTIALGAGSTADGFNGATLSVTATGTAAEQVSFEIPSTSITLDSKAVRPGGTFTVTVPVKNTTDRQINVVVTPTKNGAAATSLTITGPGTAIIEPGASSDIVFTFSFAETMTSDEAGQAVEVTFDVKATGTYDSGSGNTRF